MKQLIPQSLKNIYHLIIAIIAQLWFRFPAQGMTIIGVTGTDGKTTTSTMIYHILQESNRKAALISTVAAFIENEAIDTGFHVTSPDTWQLLKIIRHIRQKNIDTLVLEVTSHGLDQHRIFGISPLIAVYTNITHEHLDYHKTIENYTKAKAKLSKVAKHVVYNQDDEYGKKIINFIPDTVTRHPYTQKDANTLTQSLTITESYNRMNATAAIKAVELIGISHNQATISLNGFAGIPGRMEYIKNNKNIHIVVDFAHTPNALKNALIALRQKHTGKIIAVFGSAGRRDPTKRPLMGKIASEYADEVILTSEDPRDEDIRVIMRHIKEGVVKNHGHIHAIIDRQKAISTAINKIAKKGDVVGVFGKGHEKSLNLDGKSEIPWSDQEAIKKALI